MILINIHNIQIEHWPFRFRVPSSRPNILPYLVDVRGAGKCDCPAGKVNKPCKHKRWAMEYWAGCWKLIQNRMTQTEAGFKLLAEFEAFIDQQKG